MLAFSLWTQVVYVAFMIIMFVGGVSYRSSTSKTSRRKKNDDASDAGSDDGRGTGGGGGGGGGGDGLTPLSPVSEFIILVSYIGVMLAVTLAPTSTTTMMVYGYYMLAMTLWLLVFGMLRHVTHYLSYKSEIRRSKKLKQKTGETLPCRLPRGYASLGTLMLVVLLNSYGLFASCMGATWYFYYQSSIRE